MTGLTAASRMEWIKLRSLRSTWWTLAVTVAGATAIAVAVGAGTKRGSGDLTNNALAGIAPGLLLIGVLGVLTMTSEYSSGMIRATLAAVPSRSLLLAAKATVFGLVTLVVGEATALLAFTLGGAALPSRIRPPSLGDPGVLRAILLSGVGDRTDRPVRARPGRDHPPLGRRPGGVRGRRVPRRPVAAGRGPVDGPLGARWPS